MAVRDLVLNLIGVDQTGPAFDGAGSNAKKYAKIGAAAFVAVSGAALGVGKALYDVGSQFDDAYDKIRTGTGKTGGSLEGLKDDFRAVVASVPADFESASTAIASVASRLDLAGAPLQALSGQFLELSRVSGTDLTKNIEAGTTALTGFGVSVAQQPAVLDQLFRASQESGVSFDVLATQLASSGSQLRAVGFDVTESTALIATLGKAGLSASDVMPALGKAMAVAAKNGQDAKTVFSDTFAAIKAAPTATAAAGVAMEVFGAKGGPKFASMIREGKLSYEDMMKAVSGGSETIMQAGADTADFAESWQMFKNRAMLALEPVATRVFTMLGEYMNKFSAWWTKNGPQIIATAKQIAQVIGTSFRAMADVLRGVFDLVRNNQTTFTVIGGIILATFVPAMITMAVTAVTSAATTVAAWATVNAAVVVAAVMARVNTAIMIAQWVAGAAASVASGAVIAASWVMMGAQAMLAAARMAAAWLIALGPIALVIAAVVGVVVLIIKYWDQIVAATKAAWDAVVGAVVWAFNLIKQAVITYVNVWKTIITTAWNAIRAVVSGAVNAVRAVIVGVFDGIKLYISTVVGIWKKLITGAWDTIVGVISGAKGRITSAASGLFDGIKDAFKGAINFIIRGWNSLRFSIPEFDTHIPGVGKVGGGSIGVPRIPELFTGGTTTTAGRVLVGEKGPEYLDLPRGASVVPLAQARSTVTDELLRELIDATNRQTAELENVRRRQLVSSRQGA